MDRIWITAGRLGLRVERWATFDCYGTIVDWNAGIRGELEKLFGVELADGLLVRYHELEPEIQAANPGAPIARCSRSRSRRSPPRPD